MIDVEAEGEWVKVYPKVIEVGDIVRATDVYWSGNIVVTTYVVTVVIGGSIMGQGVSLASHLHTRTTVKHRSWELLEKQREVGERFIDEQNGFRYVLTCWDSYLPYSSLSAYAIPKSSDLGRSLRRLRSSE